nr:HXXEE domain-containing protein [Luteibacter rhizovicinus]
MNLSTLCLFFPFILGIHNAEEYLHYGDFVRDYDGRVTARFLGRPVIRNAGVLLTLVAAVVCLLACLSQNEVLTEIFVVATFALTLNALGHIVMSLRRRSITPGTVSAVLLVLPYSVLVIIVLRASSDTSWGSILRMAGFGMLLIPLAVAVFLLLGYATWLLQRRLRGEAEA